MPSTLIPMMGRQFGSHVTNNVLREDILAGNKAVEKVLQILMEHQNNTPLLEVKYKFDDTKNRLNSMVSQHYDRLSRRVNELEIGFEDIHEKIFCLGSITKVLVDIIDCLDQENANEKYNLRSCILLHDIIKKTKIENIEWQHVSVIKAIVNDIISRALTKEDFIKYDELLLDAGLDWVYGGK